MSSLSLGSPSTPAWFLHSEEDAGGAYDKHVRTPIRNPPDPMYAEFEVHRTMICDRVRTEAFRQAIDSVVHPGDIVLDVGAGSGILSVFAARAGAGRVYAVERTSVAALAHELAAANGVADVVRVIHGDVMDLELPERVDVIVSEWLGGFGIDEGMLVPVIAARDRWLKPGGIMIPRVVTAWAGLVHDRYLGETVEFLRDNPYGVRFDDLIEKTVNEIVYSGSFRHLAAGDLRSEAGRLWTTDSALIPLERARAPHRAETLLPVRDHGTANALALWFRAELAPGVLLSIGPGDPPTHWGMTTAPLRSPVQLSAGHGGPGPGEDRPGSADGDLDQLGHRPARRRLGGARRAVGMGGDRRLSSQELLRARRVGGALSGGPLPLGPAGNAGLPAPATVLSRSGTGVGLGETCATALGRWLRSPPRRGRPVGQLYAALKAFAIPKDVRSGWEVLDPSHQLVAIAVI